MMAGFKDVIGYETIKQELRRIAGSIAHPETYERLGVSAPGGLLLYGEPGVGKSLMAESLITESGRNAYTLRKNQPEEDFIRSINSVFTDAAKNAPSIVFLDDMDKFSNSDTAHPDAEEYVAVQAAIDEVHGKGVFVLATANSILELPRSLCRPGRFDRMIEIEAPRGEDAEAIICHYLQDKQVLGDVDYKTVAHLMDGSSCAQLEALINEAGLYAGFEGAEFISMNHIISACLRTHMNMSGDIISLGADAEAELSNANSSITQLAFHESGHAVVSEILCPGSVCLSVIHDKNGKKGGFTSVWHDRCFLPLYWKKSRVYTSLGGMAAVDQCFGVLDGGSAHDLEQAFREAKSLICDDCIKGFSFRRCGRDMSTALVEAQEKITAGEIEAYYKKTKELLSLNRDFLVKTALALAENGILTAADIQRIKHGCNIKEVSL